MAAAPSRRWRFFRAGGFDQVRLDAGADLMALRSLDQKLWVALACPVDRVDFDTRTLALLDHDNDGRVRARELIEAAEWAGSLLRDPDGMVRGEATLPLSEIRTDAEGGQGILDAARQVLKGRGKPDAPSMSVEEITDAVKALDQAPLNGDGVITDRSSEDEALQQAVRDAVACVGGETDRSGLPGINQAKLDAFFADLQAFHDWHGAGASDKQVFPLGEETPKARALLEKLQPKLDDFFARVRLAGFDARAAAAMNRDDKEFQALATRELSLLHAEIAALPLAHVEAGRPLPLISGLNPAWATAIAEMRDVLVKPLIGERGTLTEVEYNTLRGRFAAYDAWLAGKKGASVEKLGADRVAALIGSDVRERLAALIAEDLALAPVAKSLESVEKLVRLRRDLYKLATNFVSFRDFFSRRDKAIFQAGTLYIDQRSCDLCMRVEDANKHAALAANARVYLAYCECRRAGKKMIIAAALTDGDSDNMMVGRNGVFYDRQGNDWDATVIKIVDHPISVRQAFWAPYKKLGRFIEDQFAKRAATADSAANSRLTNAATDLDDASRTGKAKEPAPKLDIGIVAALGVAVGGITAAMGALLQAFFGLGVWMPLGFLALLLAVSGPSMAIAWLKLRKRNLSPLLDANGWAMNSPGRINLPFGKSLTQLAELPAGSSRELKDPYAEPNRAWPAYAATAAVLALALFWWSGRADPFLPEAAHRVPTPPPVAQQAAPAAPGIPPAATATAPAP